MLILMSGCTMAVARDGHGYQHGNDPFEPTVTREESTLLNTAMRVAGTNVTQAIRMLQTKELPEASPALDFAIGNLHFQNERLDEAAAAYKAAIKKLPKFRSAIMNLGRVYLMQERTEDAITLYQQLVSDGQADADILLLLGHALLMENAPVSAESAYRQSLLLRPKHADAMLGMAKALMQQERYAEGLALVGEILQRDPANRELWSLRANAYLSMGKHTKATRTIEKARRLGCADAEMLATLGDLLLNQDQPEDALRAYEAAFTGDTPSIARMLRAIEGFLMVGDGQRASSMIARAESNLEPDTESVDEAQQIKLLRLKAELAQQEARFDDAMALCDDVLKLDPLDGRTMLVLAELQQDSGRLEDAAMTCERAARVKGYEADALIRHAQIEVARERYARAASLLEAAQTFENRPHVGRYLEQVRWMVK
ncbi:tetratricopeptide repeat protein [Kiritimatiella glycovorans]|uniref:Tetratricopeptide repeat protein n=1 Tax=Kiritimatiella glycovorans TaxID=1307763 RepID=A0A0G3EIY3_9BACT|nr:tetratricopeptide repeat protein [Kiritimatiella glycovorans]AKJ64795.1 tetratricopeptide repeat protein [Kiritimatiella glycovorans]